jgi:drug/metabolite transporter (DMT)-like permease
VQTTSTATRISPPLRAYAALAVGIVCIGWSAIFVKLAAVPGPASAFYRMFFAALLLGGWWLWKRPPAPSAYALRMTLLGGLFFALDNVIWNVSLALTTATNATLLGNNAPLWVGLGTLFILHERLPRNFWPGMLVAMAGTVLIVGSDLLSHVELGYGDLLASVAGMMYAAYLLTTQQARARLDTLHFMALSTSVAAAVLLGLCLALGTPLTGYSARSWAALLGLALVSQLGGWFAINYALGYMRAAVVSISLLGQPVFTAIFSILLLHEQLTAAHIIGGALVLLGIYVVNRQRT